PSAISLPTASIAASNCATHSPTAGPGPSKSSRGPRASKASSFCPVAGSSSEASHGSSEPDAWPRTSNGQLKARQHGFSSLTCAFSSKDSQKQTKQSFESDGVIGV